MSEGAGTGAAWIDLFSVPVGVYHPCGGLDSRGPASAAALAFDRIWGDLDKDPSKRALDLRTRGGVGES